jgi:hypothetical protein
VNTLVRAALLAVLLAVPASALAQSDDPAESRGASFQAVEGPTTEDVAGGPLLVGAYGTILVLLLAYVLWLGRLQSGTAMEIDRLRSAIERDAAKAEKPSPPAKD